jgi:hypothetical protein
LIDEGQGETGGREQKYLGNDGYAFYLDYDNTFMGVYICQNL